MLEAVTPLSQGISHTLLPLPEKGLLTWDLHYALEEAGRGSWGKGRWIGYLSIQAAACSTCLPPIFCLSHPHTWKRSFWISSTSLGS